MSPQTTLNQCDSRFLCTGSPFDKTELRLGVFGRPSDLDVTNGCIITRMLLSLSRNVSVQT